MERKHKGIRKRGDSYLIDVTIQGVRRTATAATEEAAILERARIQAELIQAIKGSSIVAIGRPEAWTLKQALDRAVELDWHERKSGTKLRANGQEAVDFFGPTMTLDRITTDRVDEYIAHLRKKGNANGTINRKTAALSKMLSIARDRGGVASKPRIQRKRETQGHIHYLTEQEETTALSILSQWGKDEEADTFIILIDTGIRPSELWRLTARDVALDTGLIHLWENKTDHPRSIPMTTRVKDIMARRVELTPSGQALFPYDSFWFERSWNRMKDTMGLADDREFIPYALRHTCASRLVQRGVKLAVVKEWMGHKSVVTTMRYAHLAPGNLADAVQVLES